MTRNGLALVSCLSLALVACGGSKPGTPVAAPATATPQSPAAKADLRTAEEVMEASIAASGGRARIAKLSALKQTGTLSIPQLGAKGTITILAAPPRNALTTVEIPGFGKIVQGVHGDMAWEMNPMSGNRVISGGELAVMLRELTFNAELAWKELYPKAELAGVVDLEGTAAYKVVLTPKEGAPQTRYIAKDTLLTLGVEMVVESQMGKVPTSTRLSDYRDVGGIKYAHKIARKDGPVTLEITVDKIELDVAIPPSTFDIPPEIQALKKK